MFAHILIAPFLFDGRNFLSSFTTIVSVLLMRWFFQGNVVLSLLLLDLFWSGSKGERSWSWMAKDSESDFRSVLLEDRQLCLEEVVFRSIDELLM